MTDDEELKDIAKILGVFFGMLIAGVAAICGIAVLLTWLVGAL